MLQPTVVYPVEIYSDQRVEELERENDVPEELEARVRAALEQGA